MLPTLPRRAVSSGNSIEVSPVFPGCGIIDECVGDVYFSNSLYEVKAGARLFRSIDVRQLLTYAALNKAAPRRSLTEIGLFNPRSGVAFTAPLEEICVEVAGLKADELLGDYDRHDITHAEEIHHLVGRNARLRKLCYRDIDITAEERTEKNQHGHAGVEADAHVGVTQQPKLEKNEQSEQDGCEDRVED
jgi:hypothetical protein